VTPLIVLWKVVVLQISERRIVRLANIGRGGLGSLRALELICTGTWMHVPYANSAPRARFKDKPRQDRHSFLREALSNSPQPCDEISQAKQHFVVPTMSSVPKRNENFLCGIVLSMVGQ